MGSRRTRGDVKASRDQWKKPYLSLWKDAQEENGNLEEYFEDRRGDEND